MATTSSLTSSVSALIKFIILFRISQPCWVCSRGRDIIAPALMLELRGVTMKCIPSPCFSSLSEGKKSYVPGWRLRDIIFVTKA